MQEMIYTVDADGLLQRMKPSAPDNEDHMQFLVAKYPELISDGDGDLLLIKREQSISDSPDGNGRWSVDHLFVTRDAVPVLVELKRAVDTRLRREVVGQMLDYAANATAYWKAGSIAESFASSVRERGEDPYSVLGEFIGDDDPADFWQRVDDKFAAGRIKLVFVADTIPRELARIVEFLNDQMRADVRAVELRWFSNDEGAVTLSPRILGETEKAAVAKKVGPSIERLSNEAWIKAHILPRGEEKLAGAKAYIDLVEQAGGVAGVARAQGSIYSLFTGVSGRPVYPFHLWNSGVVSLSLQWLKNRPAMQAPVVRQEWVNRLADIVGPLNPANLSGFPAFSVEKLNEPAIARKVQGYLTSLIDHLRSEAPATSGTARDGSSQSAP